ncbi:MAG TPA: mechanosensitive ion channel domain-containing protein, partial [Opitutales bacterium]|nr:mechanosensitive ion channel domain-containing protein [Opitutales bacterium]
FSISAWDVLAGLFTILFALWVSLAIARVVEHQVYRVPRMSGSLKVLISKVARILILIVAGMIALDAMEIDLSALTVMSGAIGLGLGFGLQKVVSNFISGIILLTDNSIKPGDVIEIEGTYGWINNLRARYASVITRDGTEHLIPNEEFITQKVTNWSFTDNLVRQRIPIGVSYGSDPHKCIEIVLEAARSIERVLENPAPACLLTGFGDSSVDVELRIWIADPANGIANVKSAVLLAVWDAFKANGIEIPFPQRDLHIKSSKVDFARHGQPDPE